MTVPPVVVVFGCVTETGVRTGAAGVGAGDVATGVGVVVAGAGSTFASLLTASCPSWPPTAASLALATLDGAPARGRLGAAGGLVAEVHAVGRHEDHPRVARGDDGAAVEGHVVGRLVEVAALVADAEDRRRAPPVLGVGGVRGVGAAGRDGPHAVGVDLVAGDAPARAGPVAAVAALLGRGARQRVGGEEHLPEERRAEVADGRVGSGEEPVAQALGVRPSAPCRCSCRCGWRRPSSRRCSPSARAARPPPSATPAWRWRSAPR